MFWFIFIDTVVIYDINDKKSLKSSDRNMTVK